MAMKTIETTGIRPAAIVDTVSDARHAIRKAMIAATAVTTKSVFTSGSWMRAASGPLIIRGVTKRPAIPRIAIRAIERTFAARPGAKRRAGRPRSQETYSAIRNAI